ncbi:MAG: aminopeptidase P family protein [Bacteroidales bacterium]|nr:aminopeptidase P family protein [Bacteroidales bacterium]
MKKLIILPLVIFFLAACDNNSQRHIDGNLAPETGDLQMNQELQKIFSLRREAVLDTIGEGLLLLRSDYGYDGGRHEYRAASNFWYLTGYAQPGTLMSLSGGSARPYALYSRERTIRDIIYSGNLPDQGELIRTWAPDTLLDFREADRVLSEAAKAGRPVYVDFRDQMLRSRATEILKQEKAPEVLLRDIGPSLAEMRVIKDDYEVRMLQKAVDITGKGISEVLVACRPGMYEFEVEALLEYVWRRNGSAMPGFESIVGSGENAVTLHYSANTRRMEEGDLLLMDLGAEYGYYTADITRTIPVSGRFTPEQRDIYALVLRAQKAAIDEMKPGAGMTAAHRRATGIIMEGLHDLGLVTDPGCQWQRKFYTIYHICHYLGLDVHDAGTQGIPQSMLRTYLTADTVVGRPLEKGMVLTVEPGIYLRANGLEQLEMLYGSEAGEGEIEEFIEKVRPVYEKYKNIGVRIEDDVLITESGNVVLSASIPKETDEIENLMRKKPGRQGY